MIESTSTRNMPSLDDCQHLYEIGDTSAAKRACLYFLRDNPNHPRALYLLASILVDSRELLESLILISSALEINYESCILHRSLGLVFLKLGLHENSVTAFKAAIKISSDDVESYNYLGKLFLDSNELIEALNNFEQALAIAPEHLDALFNKGVTHHLLRQSEEALSSYRKYIELNPSDPNVKLNLANVLHNLGELEEALDVLLEVVKLEPNFSRARLAIGLIYYKLGHYESALEAFELAEKFGKTNFEINYNRGLALSKLEKFNEAISAFTAASSFDLNHGDTYYNIGLCYHDLQIVHKAIQNYDKAISLKPSKIEAYNNKGIALIEAEEYYEAIMCFSKALEACPDFSEAFVNRALCYRALGYLKCAAIDLERALSFDVQNVNARVQYATLLLLMGEYEKGWIEFSWRFKKAANHAFHLQYEGQLWDGVTSVKGRRFLILSEEGMGDFIQFLRYVWMLKEHNPEIILEVPAALLSLVSNLGLDVIICERGKPLPHFDVYCPLLSLPLVFRTTLNSIPNQVPYISPSVAYLEKWKGYIDELSLPAKRPKIGVVWSGGVTGYRRGIERIPERRNIPFRTFAEQLKFNDFAFFSLQKGEPAESDARVFANELWGPDKFFDLSAQINDFSDTAALIHHLDLVISVDTSTAHLAAALGKPTWILNRYDNCWRWLSIGEVSPWYPTARLFRQKFGEDYSHVLRALNTELCAYFCVQ